MKYYFSFLAALLWKWEIFEHISQVLLAYGWMGVFAIATLDSALVPMPSGPDLLLIYGVSKQSTTIGIISYVLAATLGLAPALSAALSADIIVAAVGPVCADALKEVGVTPEDRRSRAPTA